MNKSLIQYHKQRIAQPDSEPEPRFQLLLGSKVAHVKREPAAHRPPIINLQEKHRGTGAWLKPRKTDPPSFKIGK